MPEPLCVYTMGGCGKSPCPHGSHTLWVCGNTKNDLIHDRNWGTQHPDLARYHEFVPPKELADAD